MLEVLPPLVSRRLIDLRRQICRNCLVRGLGRFVLAGMVLFAGIYLADCFFTFSIAGLRLAFWGFAGILIVLAAWGLVPVFRPWSPFPLASLIEKQNPDLGERLTSTVQLAGQENHLNGSPTFIKTLEEETENILGRMEPVHRGPSRGTWVLVGLALIATSLAIPPLWMGGDYPDFGRQFLLSWVSPRPELTFAVVPGDTTIARGKPLTLAGRIHSPGPRLALPKECFLHFQMGNKEWERIPLPVGREGTFAFPLSAVAADMEYWLEAGGFRSPSFRVTTIIPMQLAGNPPVTILPPPYVNPQVHPQKTIAGPKELDIVQYSKVRFQLNFNRPARDGKAELTALSGRVFWTLPLAFAGDRTGAFLEIPAHVPGTYALTLDLEAEAAITTRQEMLYFTVRADEPPFFTELPRFFDLIVDNPISAPADRARMVPPDDYLPLKVSVQDKVGVDRIEVEYRINGGTPRLETLARANGQLQAGGDYRFHLGGKVKDGDVLAFRLKASDNRRLRKKTFVDVTGRPVPEFDLEPQIIYDPSPFRGKDRWYLVRIGKEARPWGEQDILAQRDLVSRKVLAIQEKLAAGRARLEALTASTAEHQSKEVKELRKEMESMRRDLKGLAADLAGSDIIEGLAVLAVDIAEKELFQADQNLAQAQEKSFVERLRPFHETDQELARAQERLRKMLAANGELAGARLDHLKLQNLARRQEDLGKEASRSQGKNPKLLTGEEDLLRELLDLMRNSPVFSKPLQEAVAGELERLSRNMTAKTSTKMTGAGAEKKMPARELAKEQRRLQEAVKKVAQMNTHKTSPLPEEIRLSLQQGREQMEKALAKLRSAPAKMARPAMDRAARVLGQAARQTGRELARTQKAGITGPNGRLPGRRGAPGQGLPDTRSFAKDLRQYLDASWGELPGELRTRILQDVQRRLGDDYARMIQSYFEKLAANP